MASTSPAAAKHGRPRDPGADERILQGVVDELIEVGIAGFRINSVAARAKVAKRTLYTRWPERDDLILAGLATLFVRLDPRARAASNRAYGFSMTPWPSISTAPAG